jgi:hypothetical protein
MLQRLQVLSGVDDTSLPIQQALTHLETVVHGTNERIAWELIGKSPTTPAQESLAPLILDKQVSPWKAAWEGKYRPKAEAAHARLLDEYVRAAADRAAQQQPSLAGGLTVSLGD